MGRRQLRRVIAVFGSGGPENAYAEAAGRAVARAGHDLLTGGGDGCMNSALQGFRGVGTRKGRSHAVLPLHRPRPRGYDQIIETRFGAPKDMGASPFSRNLVNVAFCHGALFITPTPGTLTEVIWMLRLGKPCSYFGPQGEVAEVRRRLSGYEIAEECFSHALTPEEDPETAAEQCLARLLARVEEALGE